MKKNSKKAGLLLGLLLSAVSVSADVVNDYTYNFEEPYGDYSYGTYYSSEKAAPQGWGHIADDQDTGSYPTYRHAVGYGVGGSNCLSVGNQQVYDDYYEDYVDREDMLVTPKVSGKVSIKVKQSGFTAGSLKLWKVSLNAGVYTKVLDITPSNVTITRDDYVTFEVDGLNNDYVAIHASSVYLDDFYAQSADVTLRPSMKLEKVTSKLPRYQDVDAEGNFTAQFEAIVTNNGAVDILPGENGYKLSMWYLGYSGNDTIAVQPQTKPLLAGKKDTVLVSAVMNIADYPAKNSYRVNIGENIGGTSQYGAYVQLVPYAPIMTATVDGVSVKDSASVAFGTAQTDVTRSMVITNSGAKELNITSINVPEGFTVDKAKDIKVAAHSSETVTITMPATAPGKKEGYLTLAGDTAFALRLSGAVVDPSAWLVDFESKTFPVNMLVEDGWEITNAPSNANLQGNKYSAVNKNGVSKIISPLLGVNAGEKLNFIASRNDENSTLKVYYSKDRKNWTLLKEFTAADMSDNKEYESYYYTYYSFTDFEVEGMPEGQYYIALEAGNTNVDNIYGFHALNVEHDLYVTSTDVPMTATKNVDAKVSVTLRNLTLADEKADNYTVDLYYNNNKVATANGVDVASGATATINLAFKAHELGKYPVYFQVTDIAGNVVKSDVDTVSVVEEVATKTVIAGEAIESTTQNKYAPVGSNEYSQSEMIIPASVLTGLNAGDKITAVSFPGKAEKDVKGHVKAWIANTTDDAVESEDDMFVENEDLVVIADQDFTVAKTDSADLITIQLPEPYEYTGGNIRMAFSNSKWNLSSWGGGLIFQTTANNTSTSRASYSSSFSYANFAACATPVVNFTVAREASVLSGNVTDKNSSKAVANAKLVLTSGDVIYDTTTDAEGKYEVKVFQDDKTYQVVTSADNFVSDTTTVTFAGASQQLNIALNAIVRDTIITTQPDGELKTYDRSGYAYYVYNDAIRRGAQTGTMDVVFADDNKVYIKDPLSKALAGTWVKATLSDDATTITLPLGQAIAYSEEMNDSVVLALMEYDEDEENFTAKSGVKEVTYTVTDGALKLNGTAKFTVLAAMWKKTGYWAEYADYESKYTYKDASDTLVVVPENLETEPYRLTAHAYVTDKNTAYTVTVGQKDNDMYIKGIFKDAKETWIKGSKNDAGQYVFKAGQYLGAVKSSTSSTSSYYMIAVNHQNTKEIQDLVLTYDEEKKAYTTDQFVVLNTAKKTVYLVEALDTFAITKVMTDGAYPVPYAEHFDGDLNDWKVFDVNNDKVTWVYDTFKGCASYNWSVNNDGDDWLVSPKVRLEAGKSYKFSLKARSFSTSSPVERLEVKMGADAQPASLTETVIAGTDVQGEDFKVISGTFHATENKTVNFGIHAISKKDNMSLYVDDVEIEEDTTTGVDGIKTFAQDSDAVYDLQGRKVTTESLKVGVYVKNGKKFVVK